MADGPVKLEKRLGLLNGCGIIIGNIVGSGIFISPKGVLDSTGSIGMSLVMWVACGLYSILGALCYAELGTTIKESGAEYAYLYRAFGPLPAFLQLWVTMLVIRPGAQAIIAMTFAQYLIQPFVGDCEPSENAIILVAVVCICFITFINCISVRVSTLINDIFMVAKILSLILIIITGAYYMIFQGRVGNFNNSFAHSSFNPFDLSMGFYNGMFAYAGWNYLNCMTDEIKNPNRNLPLAIAISLPLVTVIYVLANVAYFSAMNAPELLDAPAVGISFAEKYLGPVSWIMPILVACSTFSAVNGSILTSSRLTFVGAKFKQMPQMLAMVNLRFLTPVPSVLLTGVLSALMVLPGNVGAIMVYFSFVFYFTINLAICALIYLRFKYPNWERPIRVPIVFPIIFVLICTTILGLSIKKDYVNTGIGILMTLTAIPVYVLFIMFPNALKMIKIDAINRHITLFTQKLLCCCVEEQELSQGEEKSQKLETGKEVKDTEA